VIGSGRPRIIPGTGPERGHCDASFKRLEIGRFRFPLLGGDGDGVEIHATDLAMILEGIDLASVKRQKRYRRPEPTNPAAVS
jgi:transposase